jgi:uncharacterized protein YjlB
MDPIQLKFKDDGSIPNSKLPLLIYKNAFSEEKANADFIEEHFAIHNWKNAWRGSVYDYHHYHSTSHEVLGVASGYATIQFGGEEGEQVSVEEGDVIAIPAGTGHKKISASEDFEIVGAYPQGMDYDLLKGVEGERPQADRNIEQVPLPECDPVYGKMEGITSLWRYE